MGLSLALNTARSSLLASSAQMAVVSRNTTGAADPSYSRKIASLVTGNGTVRVVINRASDPALFYKMLGTTSTASGQQMILSGLEKLEQTVGDTDGDQSAAARISALDAAQQKYANKPDDGNFAREVVSQAAELAGFLNNATSTVQKVRADSDAAIAESVGRVNDLLQKFDAVNSVIVKGTASGSDMSDELDIRDGILAQLSEEVGINVVTRENNDTAIYTDSGVTLYEKGPRAVTFSPISTYDAGSTGNAVFVDGVQVTGKNSPMPLHSGAIAGLVSIRDDAAPQYQSQLDEIAKGLIEAFAESDQISPYDLPDKAGLFSFSGGATSSDLPGSSDLSGLAGKIRVNALVDPASGGQPERLRDGINGGQYTYNVDGNAAFSDRLFDLSQELGADRPINPALGFGSTSSLQGLAASSASWLEATRASTSSEADYQAALLGHASEALSNATGVNMDDETAMMLQLEKSYSASAKLISVINEMLQTLLDSVR